MILDRSRSSPSTRYNGPSARAGLDAQEAVAMSRAVPVSIMAGCLLALTLVCFGPVLFQDRQFSYRDSGQFYYPLYQRVQREWEAGRWPLWEPEENGGMPLLGNPSAAVL